MEKYSQYRDRASGVAPFLPIPTQPSGGYIVLHVLLFLVRLPLLLSVVFSYFTILQWLPIGSLGKKAALWLMLGIPGIWWIDLQIDGVRRGSLARHREERFPQPGSIIASSLTSPIDALYLAAIFDPIFTASYPTTRLLHRISLFQALQRAFSTPQLHPPPDAALVDLRTLVLKHPKRIIVVFPECTTSNGRSILHLSPSLLTAAPRMRIFPTNLRYTPADITSPVPGSFFTFLWNLLSKPTHCIRVRIAESVHNLSQVGVPFGPDHRNHASSPPDDLASSSDTLFEADEEEPLTDAERRTLDRIGDALARLGRVQRVGLGIREKVNFVKVWQRQQKRK